MRFCIRVVVLIDHILQIRYQYENHYIPQEHENLRLAHVYFAFLIDIVDNINIYSLYSSYYVTRTSANSSAVSLSHVSRDQYSALLLAEVLVT